MKPKRIIICTLREPGKSCGDTRDGEYRRDPFWEFGSFGWTGCHAKITMHCYRMKSLQGVRLAFAQAGSEGRKLVYITPQIEVCKTQGGCIEAIWKPAEMPLCYAKAPVLAGRDGHSDFPHLQKFLMAAGSPSLLSKFHSRFSGRNKPLGERLESDQDLELKIAAELVVAYKASRNEASIAKTWIEAIDPQHHKRILPYNRKATYQACESNGGAVCL